jgi:dipeptidyl aminopeptidase/acylaminoacyl peptidase
MRMLKLLGRPAAIVLLGLLLAGPAWSGIRGSNGGLVYVSDRDGNAEIYWARLEVSIATQFGVSFNPNASPCGRPQSTPAVTERVVETRLTVHPGQDTSPAWGPRYHLGGERTRWDIAFVSDRDGDREIYVLTIEATSSGELVVVSGAPRQLTFNRAADFAPAWSPERPPDLAAPRRIAFSSNRDGNPDIYAIESDGTGLSRLTSHRARDTNPAWSPNGTKIAFESTRGGNRELFVVAADGRGAPTQLTQGPTPKFNPSWFKFANLIADPPPDAELISFDTALLEFGGAPSNSEIFYVNADGTDQRPLGSDPADEAEAVWAPNGQCVVLQSDRTGRPQIHVVSSGGEPRRQITSAGRNRSPDWQSLDEGSETISNPPAVPGKPGVTCTRSGNRRANRIVGTPGNDVLCGKGGKDRISGRGGRDVLSGGSGRDRLRGGTGSDRIHARDGARDRVHGGRGRDIATADRRDALRSIRAR